MTKDSKSSLGGERGRSDLLGKLGTFCGDDMSWILMEVEEGEKGHSRQRAQHVQRKRDVK